MRTRATDHERERCLQDLRAAYADGCLGTDELERRAGRAAVATTRLELVRLTRDLPRTRPPAWARALDRVNRALLRAHAFVFTTGNGALVGIWALAGQGDFWPAWVLVPWTPLLAWHAGGAWGLRRVLRRRLGGRDEPERRRIAPRRA
jgi:hypothetical protein